MFFLAFLLLIAFASANNPLKNTVRRNLGDDRVLKLKHGQFDEHLLQLLHELDGDHFGTTPDAKHFKLPVEALDELSKHGIEYEDLTEEWINHFEKNFENENFLCQGSDCSKRDLMDFYASYQSLDALHERARSLVASTSLPARISSLGTSYEGRDQLSVEIGEGNKPLAMYFCNIHAREWLTPMYCIYMTEMLLTGEANELLDVFDFTIVISANPDGYVYSQTTNSMWRKTRRPNPGSSCVGTDPNRNYDYYHCGAGTSNSPCNDAYCGPYPWSEKIVQNVRDYTLQNKHRLITISDIHAYGSLWMFPFGSTRTQAEDEDYNKQNKCSTALVDKIQQISGGRRWKYGPIHSTIYPAAGSSVDWFYTELDVVYAYAAELRGSSFQPNPSNIMISNQEVFAGIVAKLECIAAEEGLGLRPVTLPKPIALAESEPCNFLFC